MTKMCTVCIEFVDAAEKARAALGNLLNAIDSNGIANNHTIELQHGETVLSAYKIANKAYQELEVFVPEDLDRD